MSSPAPAASRAASRAATSSTRRSSDSDPTTDVARPPGRRPFTLADPAPARRLRRGRGRRPGRRDRQLAQPRPYGDRRDRQRASSTASTPPSVDDRGHAIRTDAAVDAAERRRAAHQRARPGDRRHLASGGSPGRGGFAIPIDTVKSVVAQLLAHGSVQHAYLGIEAAPVSAGLARSFALPCAYGLLVEAVPRERRRGSAGLRAGTPPSSSPASPTASAATSSSPSTASPVTSVSQLRNVLQAKKPGRHPRPPVWRGKQKETVHVKLGQPARLTLRKLGPRAPGDPEPAEPSSQRGPPDEMAATRMPARVAAIILPAEPDAYGAGAQARGELVDRREPLIAAAGLGATAHGAPNGRGRTARLPAPGCAGRRRRSRRPVRSIP